MRKRRKPLASRCSRIGNGGVAVRVVILDLDGDRKNQEEERAANSNREALRGDDQCGSTIGGECDLVADAAHLANLAEVEGACQAIGHAEASLCLDPTDGCASERQCNEEARQVTGGRTERDQRDCKADAGDGGDAGDAGNPNTNPIMGGVRGTVFQNVAGIGWIDGLSSAGVLGGVQQMLFSTPYSGTGARRSVNIANGTITAQDVGAGQALGNASVFVNDVLTAYTCKQGATPTLYRAAAAFSTGPAVVGFNQCNDLIVHSGGTVWVTDPAGYNSTLKPAQQFSAIFRISADGATVFKARDFGNVADRPNGIAFSPDEKTLYVSLTNANKVVAYPVANDLTLGAAVDFVTGLTEPDGLAVDDNGNVYVTSSPGGGGVVNVYKADKTFWGKIDIPKIPVVTIGFGGADLKTLFIGTGGNDGASGLYSFPTNVPGKI